MQYPCFFELFPRIILAYGPYLYFNKPQDAFIKSMGSVKILPLVALALVLSLVYQQFGFEKLLIFSLLFIVGEAIVYYVLVWINKTGKEINSSYGKFFIFPRDELPDISEEYLDKFCEHGFDPELGWVRKPNTQKKEEGRNYSTTYYINGAGARRNPGNENLAATISTYGDSFTFCRQVDDHETWQYFLSELTKSNVLNFGVGNYGLDQSLLRLKREYSKNRTPVVVMGVVPLTIGRIISYWSYYREYGNVFGFKPRFKVEGDSLTLLKNPIDEKGKFFSIDKYLPEIQKNDYFYKNFFKKEMLVFPLQISLLIIYFSEIPLVLCVALEKILSFLGVQSLELKNLVRNLNSKRKLGKYLSLFDQDEPVFLFEKLVEEFVKYAKENDFVPVLALLPQLDDILYIKKTKHFFYDKLARKFKDVLLIVDPVKEFLKMENLDDLYTNDRYGGHYSGKANKIIASLINHELASAGVLSKIEKIR